MTKQEELLKIDRTIKDALVKSNTIKIQIDAIQKELEFLNVLENQLEQNIAHLKSSDSIAMASEYKKAKEDLKKTKTRSFHLKTDKNNLEKIHEDINSILENSKILYEKLSNENKNNVVQGKFGRKRD